MAKKNRKGGVHVEGSTLNVDRDMVGGDKHIHNNVQGSQVHGNTFDVGNVSGSGIVIGDNNTVTNNFGSNVTELQKLFEAVHTKIDARAQDPDVDKQEIRETVKKIEQEAEKGKQANLSKVARWLDALGKMAPDILEVAATTLLNPVAGVTVALKNIVLKAQETKAQAKAK